MMKTRLKVTSNSNPIGLFGDPEECTFFMDESRIDDIPQVSDLKNCLLTDPYYEEELNKTVF
jgi:hypothetical protein